MMRQLPTPSEVEQQHSQRLLQQLVKTKLADNQVISFADYMHYALYQPGLGYYVAGQEKLGPDGDFITAPELSPLFAQAIGNQCLEILQEIGGGIIEFGAGSGALAAHLLHYLIQKDRLPDFYYIMEVSPELRQRQQMTLEAICPAALPLVKWINQLPSEPVVATVLANEVLDAMPVHIFNYEQQNLYERGVRRENEQLCWDRLPASATLRTAVAPLFQQPPTDYTSEVNLWLKPWLKAIHDGLKQGVLLLIDYGFPQGEYYHPQRHQGTLMCHYRHHAHGDPFFYPGLQDITAHVNFTAVAQAAVETNFHVAGYCSQGHFLLNCGILDLMPQDRQDYKAAQQIKRLTLPHEMGELFKVMSLTKDCDFPLLGFKQQNQRYRL